MATNGLIPQLLTRFHQLSMMRLSNKNILFTTTILIRLRALALVQTMIKVAILAMITWSQMLTQGVTQLLARKNV